MNISNFMITQDYCIRTDKTNDKITLKPYVQRLSEKSYLNVEHCLKNHSRYKYSKMNKGHIKSLSASFTKQSNELFECVWPFYGIGA